MKVPATGFTVRIDRRAAARLRHGHEWVYRSGLLSDLKADGSESGFLASVADENGNLIGTALYNNSSQIALRMLSAGPVHPHEFPALVKGRILAALERRRTLANSASHAAAPCDETSDTDSGRLVFSEADFLPGLIVDRYADVLTVQILTRGLHQPEIRQVITQTLIDQLKPASIVERVDARVRELESMPAGESGLIWGEKTETVFRLNGVRFHYEALAGQKTGAFLDQRQNYAVAARYARGEALDVFCYQGGFALHLARVCSRVTGVDSSLPALETAERNEQLNPGIPPLEWIEANAFDLLKDYASTGQQYDTTVLDPPAFAKSHRELPAAMRGYKELNLRALKMLRPGGILVTCSCSFHVSASDFLEMLRSAAADARRSPQIVEIRGQAQDHPVLLNVPETSYLKCVILRG